MSFSPKAPTFYTEAPTRAQLAESYLMVGIGIGAAAVSMMIAVQHPQPTELDTLETLGLSFVGAGITASGMSRLVEQFQSRMLRKVADFSQDAAADINYGYLGAHFISEALIDEVPLREAASRIYVI